MGTSRYSLASFSKASQHSQVRGLGRKKVVLQTQPIANQKLKTAEHEQWFSNTQQFIQKEEAKQYRERLKDNAYRMELEREPVAGDLSGFYYHREFGLVD